MKQRGTWSPGEHKLYLEAIKEFKSWAKVSQHVKTRSPGQCRSHDQKVKHKYSKEKVDSLSATNLKQSGLKKDAATQWEPRSINYYTQLITQEVQNIPTCTTHFSTDFTEISSSQSFYRKFEIDFSSDPVSSSAHETLPDSELCDSSFFIEEFESDSFSN